MLKTLRCTKCGNHTVATSAKTLAQRILCATCGLEITVTPSPNLFERQGMMRMGDDDGGDWGGGGGDDDASEEEDDDDESEEGKKKKKKKKGFFAGLMGKVISALIGGVVLGAMCCCAVVMAFFFPSHPLVGEWENFGTQMVKVKEKDDKDKEIEKEVSQDVAYKLKLDKTDDKSGTGVYTFEGGDENAAPKTYNFKWKDFDKEKKTVVFEMNNADDKFWKDIKSPATFNVDTSVSNQLKLTSGTETMTFTKVQPAPKEGGGGKKGGGKRR
jgi:hypothetical protein